MFKSCKSTKKTQIKATNKNLGNRMNIKRTETGCFGKLSVSCYACITRQSTVSQNVPIGKVSDQTSILVSIDLRLPKHVASELRHRHIVLINQFDCNRKTYVESISVVLPHTSTGVFCVRSTFLLMIDWLIYLLLVAQHPVANNSRMFRTRIK